MTTSRENATAPDAVLAALAMIGACALIAVTSLLAKVLGVAAGDEALHPLQISAGRFAFAWVTLAVFIAVMRPKLRGGHLRMHLGRATCGWLGVTCMFAAVSHMPLADATALTFLSPIFTMLFAIPILGDRIGPRRWIAVGVSMVGAAVLTGVGTGALQSAAFIALTAAVLFGMESIFVKRLSEREAPIRILFVNNSIGAVVAVCVAAFVWRWPSAEGWALLALLGVAMVCAQALFIQAMKRSKASHIVPLFYTTLVFAAVYDFALFNAAPTAVAWTGAALIVSGSIAATLLNRQPRRPSAARES
ncbi:MAG: DMT family transporter [Pseudomonadota bacterium]